MSTLAVSVASSLVIQGHPFLLPLLINQTTPSSLSALTANFITLLGVTLSSWEENADNVQDMAFTMMKNVLQVALLDTTTTEIHALLVQKVKFGMEMNVLLLLSIP